MPWRKPPTAPPPEREVELLKQELLKADAQMVSLKNNAQTAHDAAERARKALSAHVELIQQVVRRVCTGTPEFQAMQIGGANRFLTMNAEELLEFLAESVEAERLRHKQTVARLEQTVARKEKALADSLAYVDDLAGSTPPTTSTTVAPEAPYPETPIPEPQPDVLSGGASPKSPLSGGITIAGEAGLGLSDVLPAEATARTLRLTTEGDARIQPIEPAAASAPKTPDAPRQDIDDILQSMDATLQWLFTHIITSGYSRYREVLVDETIITRLQRRAIYGRLSEIRELNLITTEQTIRVTRSRGYQIFALTPVGRAVYTRLTGEEPPFSLLERLRINHDNPTHGFLIFDTAEVMASYGWQCSIDRVNNQITFSDRTTFIPDIVAEIPGEKSQIRMIEVEIGTTRSPDFMAKCDKMYAAVRKSEAPTLYFVAMTKPVLDSLINQFSEWAVARKRTKVVGRFATLSMLEEADEWVERQLSVSEQKEG